MASRAVHAGADFAGDFPFAQIGPQRRQTRHVDVADVRDANLRVLHRLRLFHFLLRDRDCGRRSQVLAHHAAAGHAQQLRDGGVDFHLLRELLLDALLFEDRLDQHLVGARVGRHLERGRDAHQHQVHRERNDEGRISLAEHDHPC